MPLKSRFSSAFPVIRVIASRVASAMAPAHVGQPVWSDTIRSSVFVSARPRIAFKKFLPWSAYTQLVLKIMYRSDAAATPCSPASLALAIDVDGSCGISFFTRAGCPDRRKHNPSSNELKKSTVFACFFRDCGRRFPVYEKGQLAIRFRGIHGGVGGCIYDE